MEFPYKNVVVIGLGISGLSVAKKLNSIGINVLLTEVKEDNEKKRIAVELEKKGIKVVFGKHKEEFLNECDLVIPSPGVSIMEPFFQKVKELRIPIWSEVELGYQFIKNKNPTIIGVTGTNGKTTTVTLIGEILKKAGKKVKIVGNIGYPFINAVDNAEDDSMFVVELSSFQLYFIKEFKPFISCILNVKEDHFDWHPTFHDYIQAKSRILMNQTSNDYALFNFYDDISKNLSREARARIVIIGENNTDYSAYIKDNFIMSNIGGEKKVIELEKIKLKGRHNVINIMFALVTSQLLGVREEIIKNEVESFEGLSHRLERVRIHNGIEFIDDSKATNPSSLYSALDAFEKPVILLVGGKNKGSKFDLIATKLKNKCKDVILFGEAADELESYLGVLKTSVIKKKKLGDAIKEAFTKAVSGDVILLSPGCASFDEFSSYRERGEFFKDEISRRIGNENAKIS